jgi:hypothetical protein
MLYVGFFFPEAADLLGCVARLKGIVTTERFHL